MITVIGHDGGALAPAARAALEGAACVAGAPRHLDTLPVPATARRVTLGALEPAIDEVLSREGPSVVVASGDPGFFGIVRVLRARGAAPRVIPAVSSVAVAFGRLGVPWDDARPRGPRGRRATCHRPARPGRERDEWARWTRPVPSRPRHRAHLPPPRGGSRCSAPDCVRAVRASTWLVGLPSQLAAVESPGT